MRIEMTSKGNKRRKEDSILIFKCYLNVGERRAEFFEDFRAALDLNDGGKLLPLADEKLLPKEAAEREERNISTYHFWPAACGFPILRERFWRNYADRNSHDFLVP